MNAHDINEQINRTHQRAEAIAHAIERLTNKEIQLRKKIKRLNQKLGEKK